MPTHSASAHGKIILSGEYAVVFGYKGIAIPAKEQVTVTFEEDSSAAHLMMQENDYAKGIVGLCEERSGKKFRGSLTIETDLPIGKGMGSSTALVVALSRCLMGNESKADALEIENTVNPGHSGLDFEVIWSNAPVLFQKGKPPERIDLPAGLLKNSQLIDTGAPDQTTSELISWITSRETELHEPLKIIGECAERILAGEPLKDVMRDHHLAQVMLGVVPETVQKMIAEIEAKGGSAKVLGAGARTGGGGMVLVLK